MKLNKFAPILGIAVLSMAFATSSIAQSAGSAGGSLSTQKSAGKAKHPLIAALGQLNLSAEQKSKITQILATAKKDNKVFKATHAGDKAAVQAHHKAERKTTMEAVKGVLSKAQWQQLSGMLHHGKAAKGIQPL